MRDRNGSLLSSILANLVVVVPAILIMSVFVWFFAVVQMSQGVTLGIAVGKASLTIIGLYAFVIFGWWVSRRARG